MEQYIPKSALLAEIKRILKEIPRGETDKRLQAVYGNEAFVLMNLSSFIDTLEIKEVDLEKEIDNFMAKEWNGIEEEDKLFYGMIKNDLSDIAKHFFELGLKAQKVKEADTWHLQEKENIYDAVKGWDLYTFVCVMKDGTIQKFTGNLDEDCEGHINVHVDGVNDDYDNVDDIVKWIELT